MNGGKGFLEVIISAVRARILPLVSKIKMWLTPSYFIARLKSFFSIFVQKIMNIKPQHQHDYYDIAKWQVSKKLAYFIVIIIGLISAIYLISMGSSFMSREGKDHLKTYKYNNVLLRFAKGDVGIKGKSGYLAYEGEVSKGACNGKGSLYRPDGSLVYTGDFASSMYEGEGSSYYPNGNLQYEGKFHENEFSGTGTLYRQNGSKEYEGAFAVGKKEGVGTLCNSGSNPIYTGLFANDYIIYNEMLGKKTSEIAQSYTGKSDYYESENEFIVHMKDINAMYVGAFVEDMVEDEITTDVVYVLDNTFHYGLNDARTIAEVNELIGPVSFEGNAYINLPEVLAINIINTNGRTVFGGKIDVAADTQYKDYIQVNDFDGDKLVYLYGYEVNGLLYNFVCDNSNSNFDFYFIQLLDEDKEE